MATLQEYKCPRCGGALQFDPGAQKVVCPYCGTEFDVENLLAYDQGLVDATDEMNWNFTTDGQWEQGETDGMLVYVCKSCGGEIVADATTAATSCPYCGNPVMVKEQFQGDLKPDYVIPFKLDKKAAKQAYLNHLEGKKLLPKVFKEKNHIDEIKGVYVPVWLFDTDTETHMQFRGEQVRRWTVGDTEYIQTDYYALRRGGYLAFDNVPVDGSSKMDDDMMESLEPFDFSQAVDFRTAYLAGYLADRYDVTDQESIQRANERIRNSVVSAFERTTMGYSSVITESSQVRLVDTTTKYALYPVWLLSTTYEGKNYLFAMNGQTGKFVGDLPEDKSLRWKYFFRIFAGVTAAGLLLSYVMNFLL